ncbi:hypothetical protein [Dyella sp.]|jgi:hypothetical protein|uniref:hypothetical protein n=1 Tax=Dyella sp. TaxID=1869338 RepID=UPI002D773E3B|nr:hypothetical protein [Dyella sp.]HET6432779.1 hypothetical protein [Dyella sp.]
MTRSLIAQFDSQFHAAAAADKLFSLGLARDALLLQVDERGMQPPSSSFAPTTVVTPVTPASADPADTARDKAEHKPPYDDAATEDLRGPAVMGWARLTVALPCALTDDELAHTLEQCGATEVLRSDLPAGTPNPAMWPVVDTVKTVDVERARAAARGGEALGEQTGVAPIRPRGPGER